MYVSFYRRSIVCFFVMMLMLLSCFLRVAVTATGGYGELCDKQIEKSVFVCHQRGTVYDTNMTPITNTEKRLYAAINPSEASLKILPNLLQGEEYERVKAQLQKGETAVCEVKKRLQCEDIAYKELPYAYSMENSLVHTVGYIDSDSQGLNGVQRAYNDILFSEKNVEAKFSLAGDGSVLKGIPPKIEKDAFTFKNGVVTTIDLDIQRVLTTAAEGLYKGAIVLCEAQSGKIRGMVSKPLFNPYNMSLELDNQSSPLINRATTNFSVGSVFKPCVAAAALEEKKADFKYNCVGFSHIVDRDYRCHNLLGHGNLDMDSAISHSCNTFFYNFALHVGATPIYIIASSLSFGQSIRIGKDIKTQKGILTNPSLLQNEGALANFSIGQGNLSLSPVSLLTLYCAIATDGSYYIPSIIEKTIKNGEEEAYDKGAKTRVFSKSTADRLKASLSMVIEQGTGTDARPTLTTAAGKTATAQTGKLDSAGSEITNSWFCGFFPAGSPQYVMVVLSEGASKQSTSQIFANAVDEMHKIS